MTDSGSSGGQAPVDLVVRDTLCVATMDDGLEIPGGWVAVDGGLVVAVGLAGTEPAADKVVRPGTASSRRA
jgi:8-oxoguanine deaminase